MVDSMCSELMTTPMACKICGQATAVRYHLRCGPLYVCVVCNFHQLDYLDNYDEADRASDGSVVKGELVDYIENQLHSCGARFDNQIHQLIRQGPLVGKRLLDVGCGGGLFLKRARDLGAEVKGIELDDARAWYCRSKYRLDVTRVPIENEYWEEYKETFDIITLWDVIER